MKIAVFPGSFDPITLGHLDIVERAIPLFDQIIVAIGTNTAKKNMWSTEERQEFIQKTFANHPSVVVKTYQGLTADFCKADELNSSYAVFETRPISITNRPSLKPIKK